MPLSTARQTAGHPGSAAAAEPERRLDPYRDERLPVRDREAVLRLPDERVDDFLVPPDLRAEDFFAVDLRLVDFLVVDFRDVDFFADDLRVVDFFADDFFFAPPVLRVVVLRADAAFRDAVFFFAAPFFFAPDFFAVDFFFDDDFFRAPELRVDPERELLPEERDDDRVVAGTAIERSISAPSLASPIADSPHASSASAAGSSPQEPAVGVPDASPVPLQSSSVMQ